eukprot:6272946-Pyramimonas_sp.AAC.1
MHDGILLCRQKRPQGRVDEARVARVLAVPFLDGQDADVVMGRLVKVVPAFEASAPIPRTPAI